MKDIIKQIEEELFALQDKGYKEFQSKLIPNISKSEIIGVRTNLLRELAKRLIKQESINIFLHDLPHKYFDENQLHIFIVSEIKDFNICILEAERFLPYVNNWATCDMFSPKCFEKNKEQLLPYIYKWTDSSKEYSVRFAIGLLMKYFLAEDFKEEYLNKVVSIKREEYYIKMMQAWYIATALAKNYSQTISILQKSVLDKWTHNRSIQKAVESFRISDEQKTYLKSLKL